MAYLFIFFSFWPKEHKFRLKPFDKLTKVTVTNVFLNKS